MSEAVVIDRASRSARRRTFSVLFQASNLEFEGRKSENVACNVPPSRPVGPKSVIARSIGANEGFCAATVLASRPSSRAASARAWQAASTRMSPCFSILGLDPEEKLNVAGEHTEIDRRLKRPGRDHVREPDAEVHS